MTIRVLIDTQKFTYGPLTEDFFADLGFTSEDWSENEIHVYLNGMRVWETNDYTVKDSGIVIHNSTNLSPDAVDHITVDVFGPILKGAAAYYAQI